MGFFTQDQILNIEISRPTEHSGPLGGAWRLEQAKALGLAIFGAIIGTYCFRYIYAGDYDQDNNRAG